MTKLVPLTFAISIMASGAIAQTTPSPAPSTPPAATSPSTTTTPSSKPSDKAATPSAQSPTATAPSGGSSSTSGGSSAATQSTTAPSTTASRDVMLTEEEARNWIDKVVYSKDNQNVGEVAAFNRDASGKVTELHADIGGFMGLGERRVKLEPSQFKLEGDRVVLNITSEEVKALPAIAKN